MNKFSHPLRYLIGSLITVAVFALGYYLACYGLVPVTIPHPKTETVCNTSSAQPQTKRGSYEQGFQDGLGFARSKATEAGFAMRANSLIESFVATIKSVQNQSLVVDIDASKLDFLKSGTISKTITISDKTVLERKTQKPADVYASEIEQFTKEKQAYLENYSNSKNPSSLKQPQRPLPYIVEKINFGDFKVGDSVTVDTSSDIRSSDSFEANSISINVHIPGDSTNPLPTPPSSQPPSIH